MAILVAAEMKKVLRKDMERPAPPAYMPEGWVPEPDDELARLQVRKAM